MKDFLKVYWPLILVAVAGVFLAMRFVEPPPPKSISFAAGSPGGAYSEYANRYAALLEEHGVTVEVMTTAGSLENLRLLTSEGDDQVDVALVQGGIADPGTDRELVSLGGLFYEPFWVFARADLGLTQFAELQNVRLAIGTEGSGTRALAQHIQREFGGAWSPQTTLPVSGQAAADGLLAGDFDAVVFAAGISAPYVDQLLRNPSVVQIGFPRAPAIAQRAPALAELTLLRGVVDIGGDLPAENVQMIAPVAQLTVRDDLHPAIHSILLEAAVDIHSDASLLARPNRFPDGGATDLPLSQEAERFYRDGPSALRRYFSFGMANFLERAWILLIPLVTLLIPLVRAAPPIYRWRVRRKIYVWYEDLRELERRGRAAKSEADRELVRKQLSKLQEEIGKLEVPLSYTDDLYRLRSHVAFVNQLLGNLDPAQKVDPLMA
ncbi:MAG: TAXI family TRAP transporter solute-binding subunit [Pseudomonadota bacterium]